MINSMEAVQESAVVGVPSELTEEEVLAVVVVKPGASVTEEEIVREVNDRMPHFAVPRYIRFAAEIPKNQAQRVQKFVLREAGLTDDTWDREAAGVEVTR